ncbi:MAG: DUF4838 domain-containing protein [Lentisphaeria bacterium]|nr:DUF4838 domain-containing protein [Lentisphaeria bacterium]
MKKLWLLLLGAFAVMTLCSAPCVVVSGDTPGEKSAAAVLREYLGKITGGTYEVSVNGVTPVIFRIMISPELTGKPDAWSISSQGRVVTLSGNNERGTVYAVSHLLEDFCGVFFFTPYEEYVPSHRILKLPALSATGQPYFIYRHIYRGNTRKPDKGRFAALRMLNNDNTGEIRGEYGGSYAFGPPRFVHTMWSYVPAEKYFTGHPEYFALVNNVRRAGRESQLCFSNPDLPEVIYDQLITYIAQGDRSAAGRRIPRPLLYDISINDNWNYCRCETCAQLIRKHGHSGALLHLLNAVAVKLKAVHPEIKITTLAYNFTVEAPKDIVAEDNIIIRLCPRINQAASIMAEENRSFRESLISWSKVCKNLFIWDYAVTYIKGGTGMPFASELYYGDRYRFYADNKVKGIMWEHPFEPEADMYELKFYLETKLMEDPYADTAALTDRFMRAYYGAAAPEILSARRALDEARMRSGAYIRFMSPPAELQYATVAQLRHIQSCFDRAEKAVSGDALLLSRVRRARKGIDRVCVFRALPPVFSSNTGDRSTYFDRELASQALARLKESWLPWLTRYARKDELTAAARHEINQYQMVLAGEVKTPEKFAGMSYYDFTAAMFQNHDLKAITLVSDPESEAGFAVKITVSANPGMYDPPFVMGFRDRVAKTTVNVKVENFPQEKGYHWYKLGVFTLPKAADIFLSRSWGVKLHLSNFPETGPLEFWVSVKFAGAAFREGDTAENAIYIDRVVAVLSEKIK